MTASERGKVRAPEPRREVNGCEGGPPRRRGARRGRGRRSRRLTSNGRLPPPPPPPAAEAAAAIGLERRLSSGSHGDLLGTMGGHPMPSFANAGGLMTTIDTTSGLPTVDDHDARLALLGVENDDHLDAAARAAGLGTAGRTPEDVSAALMKQIEMQSQLHEQLMEQRKLQQRIEAHGKYLESILERQQRQQHQQHQNEDSLPPGSLS